MLIQDARTVKTKFSKTFDTWFFPVGDDIESIVLDWLRFLTEEKQWALDDPLFPRPRSQWAPSGLFEPSGLAREHWSGTGPIRAIFRDAFKLAGLPYFNPHSFRNTIVAFASEKDLTLHEMQAWAQNLGHTSFTTTFGSYGQVPPHQQGDLVRNAGTRKVAGDGNMQKLMTMVSEIHANQSKGLGARKQSN